MTVVRYPPPVERHLDSCAYCGAPLTFNGKGYTPPAARIACAQHRDLVRLDAVYATEDAIGSGE